MLLVIRMRLNRWHGLGSGLAMPEPATMINVRQPFANSTIQVKIQES
jgi:hypothetical protein